MSEPRPHVLLIGIDGLRWVIVSSSPLDLTLRGLARDGDVRLIQMPVPTLSGPGWTTLLTGRTITEHGITDNRFAAHRFSKLPDLLTRGSRAQPATRTFAAAGWEPLVSPRGPGPIIWERAEQQRADMHRTHSWDGDLHGFTSVDERVRDVSLDALSASVAPDLSFVYFGEVDIIGHEHGALSIEYEAALNRVDTYISTLAQAVSHRASAFGEEWIVVVVTDHSHVNAGGHGGGSPEERTSFIVRWSPSGHLPTWPDTVAPHELADLLLALRE